MSDVQDDDSNSVSHSHSSQLDELENGYESNETDSLNLDEEEEEVERGEFPLPYLSDRIVGGSLVLHIDQTGASVSAPSSLGLESANHSTSTTTSLSDTASDNMSTRAVMGDASSTAETNPLPPGEEDAADNSSQGSMADSEADRVRRIHNSIFSSLEQDLAELVRIREETIQFLESGVRSHESISNSIMSDLENGNRNSENLSGENQTFPLRERLTYYSRPYTSGDVPSGILYTDPAMTSTATEGNGNNSFVAMQARSYTPIAKFDTESTGKPAKPYLETGLTSCDEKAIAARKILDKLQYGDPEDEGACFVRRFWRETSTVVDNSPTAPLSLDVAAIAQRTASLQASLEEAFDGLRLRLQQVQSNNTTSGEVAEESYTPREPGERNANGESGNNERNVAGEGGENRESAEFQAWDEETSILNNPLNYDIWNELEDGNEAGPTITARINMAERRALATNIIRAHDERQPPTTSNNLQRPVTTSSVGVGTDNVERLEGAELDDDSTDDEEMMSYFRVRCNGISNRNRPSILPQTLSEESRAFFQDVGISDEMGQDLFNMFTFSEEQVQIPSNLQPDGNNGEMVESEMPEPLFPRDDYSGPGNETDRENNIGDQTEEIAQENENCTSGTIVAPPQLPLFDTAPCVHIAPNREDDCSTRVYLDEEYLNFPVERQDANHNDDH